MHAERRLIDIMRLYRGLCIGLAGVALRAHSPAQTHKVARPETVVRAVGVYEWTGEMAKPNASRLIPITLYIDQHLEDAGLYLARPVPFALQTGNVYELDQAGVPKGSLDLVYARHLQAATTAEAYDDGWFGYGSFQPLAVPKKPITRKTTPARISGMEVAAVVDPDKPHFVDKAGQPVTPGTASSTASTPAKSERDDPDRPTMKRHDAGDSSAASTASTGSAPSPDPDRPTMKRRDDPSTESTPAEPASTSTATDDPERPTLKRHSAEDAKKAAKAKSEASVTGESRSLNEDPDRPNLHRGKPVSSMNEADLPRLAGLPQDLRQMVAVSDAANRPVHDFMRPWEDDAERMAVLGKMQSMALAQLAAYGASAPTPKTSPTRAARQPDSKRRSLSAVRITSVKLLDEKLSGYLLSYGDAPTFVYQAHTEGTGAELRYVTLIAQRDAQGEPVMALHSVTDAGHLDRTARLRLVDAVDIEASNRASLVFEMRGRTTRQFGVYRVLGQHAEQTFATGTMQ